MEQTAISRRIGPKNCAMSATFKSIDAVRAKLKQAILYIERNPRTVQSITSFPYIVKSL
jgi:hypothetical protein